MKSVRMAVILLCAMVVLAGCATFHPKAQIRNGGDAPQFEQLAMAKSGDYGNINAGDAVAVFQGNIDQIEPTSETMLYLLVKKDQAGELGKQQEKSAGKEAKNRRKEETKNGSSKYARKQGKNESKSSGEGGKNQAKQSGKEAKHNQKEAQKNGKQGAKNASKNKEPKFVAIKQIATKPAAKKFGPVAKIRVGKDEMAAKYRVGARNGGKLFNGDMMICDRLESALTYDKVVGVYRVKKNGCKTFLLCTGIIFPPFAIIGGMLNDFSYKPVDPASVGFSDSVDGDLVKFQLKNLQVKKHKGYAVAFTTKVKDPVTETATPAPKAK